MPSAMAINSLAMAINFLLFGETGTGGTSQTRLQGDFDYDGVRVPRSTISES